MYQRCINRFGAKVRIDPLGDAMAWKATGQPTSR
jgi:hypothetical protein